MACRHGIWVLGVVGAAGVVGVLASPCIGASDFPVATPDNGHANISKLYRVRQHVSQVGLTRLTEHACGSHCRYIAVEIWCSSSEWL